MDCCACRLLDRTVEALASGVEMLHDQFGSRGDLKIAAVRRWRGVELPDERLWVGAILVAGRDAETRVFIVQCTAGELLNARWVDAVESARALINESTPNLKRYDKASRKRFTRLFKDPKAISVTVSLTDEVMRITSAKDSVRILRKAAKDASIAGFGLFNTFGLKLIAVISKVLPKPVLFAVHTQVKLLSRGIILPAESKQLARQIKKRAKNGIRLNINVLGEAVLGDHEASERFDQVLQMMARSEVDYVSVKLSSVASQIIALDRVGTLDRVSEKLRQLYRQSIATGTFVNLDMEEFRDLRLTVDAFKLVLSEGEFKFLI